MLRWIDTHNHLFVLPEEQQKKEVSEARKVGVVSSLVCAGGVNPAKHLVFLRQDASVL